MRGSIGRSGIMTSITMTSITKTGITMASITQAVMDGGGGSIGMADGMSNDSGCSGSIADTVRNGWSGGSI